MLQFITHDPLEMILKPIILNSQLEFFLFPVEPIMYKADIDDCVVYVGL